MVYLFFGAVLALWAGFDAFRRGRGWHAAVPALYVLILFPVALPWYLSRRPLFVGEMRVGGRLWAFVRYFGLLWTPSVFILYLQSASYIPITGAVSAFFVWLIGMLAALLIGSFAKTAEVEHGELIR
jgi:hypothetical protein